MRIAVENTTWNNIGDGFYQTSIQNLLQSLFPESTVSVFEGPMTRAFKPRYQWLESKAFDLGALEDADLYVLSGPILTNEFAKDYEHLIKRWREARKPYLILSAHGISSAAIDVLRPYPPIAISTRDEITYDALSGVPTERMNGVCFAFFVSRTIKPCDIVKDAQFITSSFYKSMEPSLMMAGSNGPVEHRLKLGDITLYRKSGFFHRGAIVKHLVPFKTFPESVGAYKIIRVNHDIGMRVPTSHYAYPNSFFSYNPSGYLSLYKHTACTVTDRVHAAVVTMSYGNPAIYCSSSNRDGLFSAQGITSRQDGVLRIKPEVLDKQFELASNFIRAAVARI